LRPRAKGRTDFSIQAWHVSRRASHPGWLSFTPEAMRSIAIPRHGAQSTGVQQAAATTLNAIEAQTAGYCYS